MIDTEFYERSGIGLRTNYTEERFQEKSVMSFKNNNNNDRNFNIIESLEINEIKNEI